MHIFTPIFGNYRRLTMQRKRLEDYLEPDELKEYRKADARRKPQLTQAHIDAHAIYITLRDRARKRRAKAERETEA